MALGDLNGDHKLDIVVANALSDNVSVLLADGMGSFGAHEPAFDVGSTPWTVALGDLNGDGKLDIVVSNICIQQRLGPPR